MNTETGVERITVIAAVVTIIGSIIATNMTNNAEMEKQRVDAVREMKRVYYNQLIEATTEWQEYVKKPNSIERTEAEMKFMLEANRVPLYASQEMVEFINEIKDPVVAKNTSMGEFFIIMRNDLCSDDFNNFNNIKTEDISLAVSEKVIVTDEQGNKYIQ